MIGEKKVCKQCHRRRDIVLFRNMGTYVSLGEVIQRKDSICKECRDANDQLSEVYKRVHVFREFR